ncbi:hypothetical protein Barb6_00461 [Bacteroidales bacterium Barb6]|nr:hypothetical protein Barb6_00461 [Bacteroidales bacterium Barb6]
MTFSIYPVFLVSTFLLNLQIPHNRNVAELQIRLAVRCSLKFWKMGAKPRTDGSTRSSKPQTVFEPLLIETQNFTALRI